MAPKGGTFFFLLLVACAALAMPPDGRPENKRDFKDMARKLMRKCQTKGYPAPEMIQLKTIFNNSDLPVADRKSKQSGTLLPTFLNVLHSVSTDKEMTTKTWNFRNLPTMLRLMRNSSVASACYMQAFLAPLCWETLTTRSENNMTSDEYDTLLSAAKPALWNMPLNLPSDVGRRQNLKKMMKVLKEVYDAKSRGQRTQVVRWVKEQITQKYFNCTMRPPSDPRSMLMKSCKPSLEWLNLEALTMMGPYVSRLATRDVDSSPKEQLCDFFRSAQFKSATINPSLGKKFLQKFQECFRGKKEFAENVDKLGILACHYSAAPDLTPDISRKLLFQLKCCDDFRYPYMRQLKKRLVRSVMSNTNSTEALGKLGTSVALLSPKQLFEIPDDPFKEFLKNVGSTVQWTRGQLRTLSKKLLCNNVSLHDCWKSGAPMRSLPQYLQPVAGGLPSSVLKRVKNIVLDKEGLNNMCMQMTKGQLTAMLQGPLGQMAPSELVQKLSGRLLRRLSLNKLDKANTSLDQMMYTNWSLPQAALNAKKMHDGKKFPWIGRDRKLHSVFQGVTAEMIDDVADNEMQDIVQAIAETPQWLSKVQAGRLARKLFATKEKERTDYFKTITVEEMNNIPTCLLLRLPPGKVGDLPDSVCPVLLEKIEEANLSSLPHRSPSRPAFTQRALLCLAEGRDLSGLTNDTVSMLGPLLCELQPSQLLQMAPDVLNFSLQEMASCQHIPQRHRADIIQLVTKTFGDPSNWTAETMETLGPLLLLDDNATSALPYKPWMKDVLYSLKSGMHHPSNALRKKIFDLTTTTPNAASKSNDDEVTVALIEELEMNNVYWKPTQLAQMSNKVFLATLETLGAVSDYGADQLVVLSKKATEVFGPVSQMTESVVIQLGCIIRGFSNADLEKLPISLDTLEEIAKCGWNESQMEAVWKGVASYSNLKVQQLDAADMVALSQFICGLNPSEFGQLDVNAFKDAVGSMDGVQCSYKVAQQLKNLAVSAFGKPNTWTEAQVSELGNIIAGLDPTELASLDPAVFSFISKSCIPHMLHFAVLSVNQLTALGPDNAAMVTSEQRSSLSDEQLATLKSALTGSPDQTQRSTQSGTPSLNVEGISALMKPFLALLMGFLLL